MILVFLMHVIMDALHVLFTLVSLHKNNEKFFIKDAGRWPLD